MLVYDDAAISAAEAQRDAWLNAHPGQTIPASIQQVLDSVTNVHNYRLLLNGVEVTRRHRQCSIWDEQGVRLGSKWPPPIPRITAHTRTSAPCRRTTGKPSLPSTAAPPRRAIKAVARELHAGNARPGRCNVHHAGPKRAVRRRRQCLGMHRLHAQRTELFPGLHGHRGRRYFGHSDRNHH